MSVFSRYLAGMDFLDALLAPLFALPGHTAAGQGAGVLLLAFLAAVLGEATVVILALSNRARIGALHDLLLGHVVRNEDAKDRDGSPEEVEEDQVAPGLSREDANHAMGKAFLAQLIGAVGSLWPALFVLGWLQGELRGQPVDVPLFGLTVGHALLFLVGYLPARLLLRPVGSRWEGVRTVRAQLEAIRRQALKP